MQALRELFNACHKKIGNKLSLKNDLQPSSKTPQHTMNSPLHDLPSSLQDPLFSRQSSLAEQLSKAVNDSETRLQQRIAVQFPNTHRTLLLQKFADSVQHIKSIPALTQTIQRSDPIKTARIVHTHHIEAEQQKSFLKNILVPFVLMDKLCVSSINDLHRIRQSRTTALQERIQTFNELETYFLGCYQLSEVEYEKRTAEFIQFNVADFLALDSHISLELRKFSIEHKHPCQERSEVISGLIIQLKSLYTDIAKHPESLPERLRLVPITQLNQFHQFDLEAQKCLQSLDALRELSTTASSKKMITQTISAIEKQYTHYMTTTLKPVTKDTISAIHQIDQFILEIQKLKFTEAPSYWNEVIETHLNDFEKQIGTHNDPLSVKLHTDLPQNLRQLLIPSQSIEQLIQSFSTHTKHLTGKALKAATSLVDDLNKNIREYLKSGDFTPKATETLLKTCRTKIEEVTPELQHHRGWTKFLVNTLLSLSLIGILLLIPTSSRQWLHHHLFRTKSASMSDHVSEKLSHFTEAIKSPTCG